MFTSWAVAAHAGSFRRRVGGGLPQFCDDGLPQILDGACDHEAQVLVALRERGGQRCAGGGVGRLEDLVAAGLDGERDRVLVYRDALVGAVDHGVARVEDGVERNAVRGFREHEIAALRSRYYETWASVRVLYLEICRVGECVPASAGR